MQQIRKGADFANATIRQLLAFGQKPGRFFLVRSDCNLAVDQHPFHLFVKCDFLRGPYECQSLIHRILRHESDGPQPLHRPARADDAKFFLKPVGTLQLLEQLQAHVRDPPDVTRGKTWDLNTANLKAARRSVQTPDSGRLLLSSPRSSSRIFPECCPPFGESAFRSLSEWRLAASTAHWLSSFPRGWGVAMPLA